MNIQILESTVRERLVFMPETPKEGFELGKIIGKLSGYPDSLRNIIIPDGSCSLIISGERYNNLQNQLNIVDELLDWTGNDMGRIDRIKRLIDVENRYLKLQKDKHQSDDGY